VTVTATTISVSCKPEKGAAPSGVAAKDTHSGTDGDGGGSPGFTHAAGVA
jgi:hypothetical protein